MAEDQHRVLLGEARPRRAGIVQVGARVGRADAASAEPSHMIASPGRRSAAPPGLSGPTEIPAQENFFPLVPQGHGTENAIGAFTKLQIRGILIIERRIEGGLEGSQGMNWAECMPA